MINTKYLSVEDIKILLEDSEVKSNQKWLRYLIRKKSPKPIVEKKLTDLYEGWPLRSPKTLREKCDAIMIICYSRQQNKRYNDYWRLAKFAERIIEQIDHPDKKDYSKLKPMRRPSQYLDINEMYESLKFRFNNMEDPKSIYNRMQDLQDIADIKEKEKRMSKNKKTPVSRLLRKIKKRPKRRSKFKRKFRKKKIN